MLNGHVDTIGRDLIAGWAADSDDPNRVVEVSVHVDGVERGRCPADKLRPDLRALGIYGEGRHGFAIAFVPPLSSYEDHELLVRSSVGRNILGRGHVRIVKNLVGDEAIILMADKPMPAQLAELGPIRYILHIGPHKTGTTYLQMAFVETRSELRAGGVIYPDASFGVVGPGGHSHTEFHRSLNARDPTDLVAILDRLNAEPCKTLLLSCEDLIGVSHANLHRLKSLVPTRRIEIVFYCRRWSELLPSGWQETIKQGKTHSLGEFLSTHLGDPMSSGMINFNIVLDKYADVFGIDNIRIISYNRLVELGVDLYSHFVRSVLHMDTTPVVPTAVPNRSLDPVDVETVRLLNLIAAARSEPSGVDMFHRYWRNRANTNFLLLHQEMIKCLTTIRIDDAAHSLQSVHDLIFSKYKGCVISPDNGQNLFDPEVRELPFIQPTYLLVKGMVQYALDAYEVVFDRKSRANTNAGAEPDL